MSESWTTPVSADHAATAWPLGEGEMAGRIRAYDWALTPLGPVEAWPSRLKGAVELVLASPLVSALVCGPDRVLIYNDAAARLYGARHPAALGCPLPESFPDGWRTVAPLYERVFAGESVQVTAQSLDTRGEGGAAADVFDAVLIPLRNEQGRVAYAHMTGFEVGGRLRAEAALRESEALLAGQKEAFEAAVDGRTLAEALGILRNTAVKHTGEGGQCGFYLANHETKQLWHVVGMSDEFRECGDGVPVGADQPGCGLAVHSGEPVITPDALASERWEPWRWLAEKFHFRGVWSFPLKTKGGHVVGSFAMYFKDVRDATPRDHEFCSIIAKAAALIISRHQQAQERESAEEALHESEERQEFLLKLSDAMRPLVDPFEVQTVALRTLAEHLGLSRAAYWEVQEDQDRTRKTAGYDADLPPVPAETRISDFSADQLACYLAGRPFVVSDIETDARVAATRDACRAIHVRAWVGVPLVKRGRLLVVLGVEMATPYAWTDAEVELLQEAAERTWAASERARAEAALHESEEKYRTLFETMGQGYAECELVRGPDGHAVDVRYIALNPALERLSGGLKAADMIGRTAREVIPDIENSHHALYERIVDAGVPERVEYEVTALGRWYECYVYPTKGDRFISLYEEITERKHIEKALRESEERFRQFADASSDVLWIRNARTMAMEYLNPAFEQVYGQPRDAILTKGPGEWGALIHPEDRAAALSALERVCQGEQVTHEFRVPHPDGGMRWIEDTDFPLVDVQGQVQRIGGFAKDVTDKKETAERMKVLVAELQHRTRNLIVVVRSVADRTLSTSSSVDEFQDRFRDRMGALGRVNGLLSQLNERDRISFDDLLRTELAGHGAIDRDGHGPQVRLEGPKGVRLRSATVQTFALGLHELATNAVKYGALSRPEGRLLVRWDLVDGAGWERRLRVEWHESGVPISVPSGEAPLRQGYGRELIERALPYQLGAETSYDLTPDGVRCTITLPISTIHREAEHA